MSEHKPKQLNFNTVLLTLVNVMILVIGFFAKHELERVETAQAKLWEGMMPRHEIEMQLAGLKQESIRIESEQTELRARLGKLELDIAKMQK